ncbi:GNAT family N-acetyltransferase [Fundidesulfovibrio butyratiphilus]
MNNPQRSQVFALRPPTKNVLAKAVLQAVTKPVSRLLALDGLDRRYQNIAPECTGRDFLREVMRIYSLGVRVSPLELERIPKTGPVVVVANHPFGGVEGVILADMLLGVRPDVKILANSLLGRIGELANLFILVNPFGGSGATRTNIAPLKQSLGWLRSGGLLGAFPAGEVASFDLRRGRVADAPWSPNVARLIRKTGATVVPVHFHGNNGPMFHLAGLIHPRLRTALLPREFVNKAKKTLDVRIGAPIPAAKLAGLDDDAVSQRLRLRVEMLGRAPSKSRLRRWLPVVGRTRRESLIAPTAPGLLAAEVAALPAACLLLENGEYSVFEASAGQIPLVLREIGRLRELSFRKVGEGTGKACDLDAFDHHYSHLFLWNRRTSEVVGAYRLGRTDEIVNRLGSGGLYVSTLFRLKGAFLRELGPALEMGRSFVRPEYQRSYNALLLLWKGIGAVVARQPRYRTLFGPVSVTGQYQLSSRQLIARYFEGLGELPALSRLVRPRKPLRGGRWLGGAARTLCQDAESLSELVSDLEPDKSGLPVLMRQYLKMGGKLLAFNVDKDFSDALDGLVVVDLMNTDSRMLERYMGKAGVAAFRAYHDETLRKSA